MVDRDIIIKPAMNNRIKIAIFLVLVCSWRLSLKDSKRKDKIGQDFVIELNPFSLPHQGEI
ncbi:hypothetical protein JYT44_00730 [Caldithrix abyssi]|nr:hypothetical protein [Caldithrix abyssi]